MMAPDRDRDLLVCVHSGIHEILERLEILEGRTTSLEEFREALRCPSCGHEMTKQPIVAVKE